MSVRGRESKYVIAYALQVRQYFVAQQPQRLMQIRSELREHELLKAVSSGHRANLFHSFAALRGRTGNEDRIYHPVRDEIEMVIERLAALFNLVQPVEIPRIYSRPAKIVVRIAGQAQA